LSATRQRNNYSRVVLVSLHTAAIGVRPRIDLAPLGHGAHAADAAGACSDKREVWFDGGWCATLIYARERLLLERDIEGPAILEQLGTTVLEPGSRATGCERQSVGGSCVPLCKVRPLRNRLYCGVIYSPRPSTWGRTSAGIAWDMSSKND